QLGTVTSTSPFELRNANINPASGVPNWPVVSGDEFRAGNTPLTLTLSDGSTVILAPHTTGTLIDVSNVPMVRLVSGLAHYTLQRDPSEVTFYCRDEKTPITSLTGVIDCGRKTQVAALWWVGGATAGATAAVLGLHNGPPVSPSQCNNGNGRNVDQPACP
ncbi:MAG TPA: hypothetical protein VGK33_12210, partial [Chloroflexota bacterium]